MTYKKIYAVDFDNTLAVTQFPEIIKPITPMIKLCKRLQNEGNIIILNTCRCGTGLVAAVDYCKEQGLVFDYINENAPENIEKYENDSRKIFAHVYIDDRSYNPFREETDDMKYLRSWQEFEESRQDLLEGITAAVRTILDPLADLINKHMDKIENILKERKE